MVNGKILSVLPVVFAALLSEGAAQCDEKQLAEFLTGKANNSNSARVVLESNSALVVPGVNYPAQVFERAAGGPWLLTASLSPSDAGPTGNFGQSADLSGNRIAIGAPDLDAVYIFERSGSTWGEAAKISKPAASIVFGTSVAIADSVLCIRRFDGVIAANFVDVFEFDGVAWQQVATLSVPGLPSGAQFGANIDVDSGRIAVSAQNEQPSGQDEGTVRIYEKQNGVWIEKAKIVPGGVFASSQFGRALSIKSNRLLASGYYLIGFSTPVPAAFVFEPAFPFWIQTAIITPQDASLQSNFGASVALGDSVACISAPASFVSNIAEVGAVYLYVADEGAWTERAKLVPVGLEKDSHLGYAMSISGQELLASAEYGLAGSQFRRAILFSAIPNPAPEYGAACAGAGGSLPSLSLKNTYDGCFVPGNGVSFDVQHGNPGGACLLFLGLNTTSLPLPSGCMLWTLPLTSATLPLFGSGGPGSGSVSFSATIPATLPPVSLYFQGFLPDAGAPAGYSATNGLRLTVN